MGAPPAVLGMAWAVLVLLAAFGRRPAPRRVRSLADAGAAHGRERRPAGSGSLGFPLWVSAVDRLGVVLLRRAGRSHEPLQARRLGAAVVMAFLFLVVTPALAVPGAALGWAGPAVQAHRVARRRLDAVRSELPDVVDLLRLAVGAGYTVRMAVAGVGRRGRGVLGAELRRVSQEAAMGRRLADALDDLPARAGEPVRPLTAALVASERYGAPLGAGLERLADEVRRDRRRRAEEAARRVPVKLLFPLVTCTLPAFALLTVAPLIASAVKSLRLT